MTKTNSKLTAKVKVVPKSKAIIPKMGKGTGGSLTARLIAVVNKHQKNG